MRRMLMGGMVGISRMNGIFWVPSVLEGMKVKRCKLEPVNYGRPPYNPWSGLNAANLVGATKVIISEGIEEVDWYYLRAACASEVVLAESVTSWSNLYFYEWWGLKSLKVLSSAEDFVLQECRVLGTVVVPSGIGMFELSDSEVDGLYLERGVGLYKGVSYSSIGTLWLCDWTENVEYVTDCAERVVLGDGWTELGYGAFQYNWKTKVVEFPESLTRIGDKCFYGCDSLESVTLPEGVTTIGSEAFAECYELKSVSLPSTLVEVGSDAFFIDGVSEVKKTIDFPNGINDSLTIPEDLWGADAITIKGEPYEQ